MDHNSSSDIEFSSVTLKTLRKEPEKNTVISNVFTRKTILMSMKMDHNAWVWQLLFFIVL